ncbi:restriction endonuclease [Methylomonas sp. 11b]|uniref:restriction endonuclease n=1 Tax=Methylomonas sp. 11b TaxID=1168169 RepID=UPI0004797E09|nr:restriction endonuclease [Methylomonas sp. 11b]
MTSIDFKNAFYIKLGQGGDWEAKSLPDNKLRFGWEEQTVDDINSRSWERIENQLRSAHKGPQGGATRALNGLRRIVESDETDIWITFSQNKLWWTRVEQSSPVEKDDTSKFRKVQGWSDKNASGATLFTNGLPGRLAMLQGYRWTTCAVKDEQIPLLRNLLNNTPGNLAESIRLHRLALENSLIFAIKELHWKDFETFVDLIFRNAGWLRVSILGQHEKAYDIALVEPITGDRYVVQIKSQAGLADLKKLEESFSDQDYRYIYFAVHSPAKDLESVSNIPNHIKFLSVNKLAEMAVKAGLVTWLQEKVFSVSRSFSP